MKKPYVKKYKKVFEFSVMLVDGKYIRENIDIEFTNCAQHYQFDFIPKNEFWIDKNRIPGEEDYYIKSMLIMNRLLAQSVKHRKAVKIADKTEKALRQQSDYTKQYEPLKKSKKKLIDFIH